MLGQRLETLYRTGRISCKVLLIIHFVIKVWELNFMVLCLRLNLWTQEPHSAQRLILVANLRLPHKLSTAAILTLEGEYD